jgi:hypothetical protein
LKTLAERLKLAPLVHFGLARSGAIRHYVRVPALRAAAERVLGFPLSRYVVQRTVLSRAGVLDDIWRKLSPGVYIFNYHRIGDPKKTDFDPNVFSCDEEHFAKQVGFLKQRFRIIGIRELVDDVLTNQRVTEPLALITFDDGYRDNFTGAFPILREANVPAVFFIPTSFVGTGQVPWWDEIAWMVRHTKLTSVALPFADARVELRERPVQFAIRDVLTAFKRWRRCGQGRGVEESVGLPSSRLRGSGTVRQLGGFASDACRGHGHRFPYPYAPDFVSPERR